METRNRILQVSNGIALITILVGVAVIIAPTSLVQHPWSFASSYLLVILSIITTGLAIFQVLIITRKLRTKRTQEQARPIRIVLEIDGEPITIETADTDRVEEILKLVQGLHPSKVNLRLENGHASLIRKGSETDTTSEEQHNGYEQAEK